LIGPSPGRLAQVAAHRDLGSPQLVKRRLWDY
jgi:hypothetical protein